jgi:hypothetical protein
MLPPDIGAFETQDLAGNAAFVAALYRDLLHRHGDVSNALDAGSWVNLLNAGTLTPQAVAHDIARSTEALGLILDGLYATLLSRPSDAGGRAAGVAFLQAGGTVEELVIFITSSPEYAALTGNNDAAFIRSLYDRLLGRTASNAEVAAWLAVLPMLSRTGVTSSFLQSTEYRTNEVEQLYGFTPAPAGTVPSLAPNLLHRTAPPTTPDVNGWVASGLDVLTMEAAFAGSSEYFLLASTLTAGVFV